MVTAAVQEVTFGDLDPFDPGFLTDPYPWHERIRQAGPVVRLDRYGVWATARYAQVRAVLLDYGTFCSAGGVGLADFRAEPPWRPPSLLLETDPPEHQRARHPVSTVLSPTVVRGLRDTWEDAADRLVGELVRRGRFDGVRELAEAFPLTVFPDAMGLPTEGRERLLPYGDMVFNGFGPHNDLFAASARDAAALFRWVNEHCQPERLDPGGLGAQLHAAAEREGLGREAGIRLIRAFLSAGIDTTVCALGSALHCLAANPDQWELLRADPGLAGAAFDEAVRLESPVQTFFRTTTRDTELDGVPIPEGAKVLLFLGGANRDPGRWTDPDRYDLTRRTAGHVGYGAGVHSCVGRALAALEGEAVLRALARHAATVAPDGRPVRRLNNTLRGLASLPLRATPA